MVSRFAIPAVTFVLTLALGLWLNRAGRPLNPILFNVHKLIALAAVVITAIQVSNMLKGGPVDALLVAVLILMGLSAVALFASGALMSMNKPAYRLLLTIHNIAPIVAVIAMALAVYILGRRT